MRISESQLRRIVRRLINEAPLVDLYPPMYAGRDTGVYGTSGELDPESFADPRDTAHAKRTYESPNFKAKLQKLLMNFPVDVYVLPVTPDVSPDFVYLAQRFTAIDKDSLKTSPAWTGYKQKIYDMEGKEFEREVKSITSQQDFRNFVENWAESAPSDACLICSFAKRGSDKQQQLTPWNVFHAMFDSVIGSTAYEILESCPSIKKIKKLFDGILHLYEELEIPVEDFEKIFTMGSVRQGYFSKVTSDNIADMSNEVATQAAITTKGFTYNSGAVIALPVEEKVKKKILSNLYQMKEISPQCKSEFVNFLKGKIIFTSTYPEGQCLKVSDDTLRRVHKVS